MMIHAFTGSAGFVIQQQQPPAEEMPSGRLIEAAKRTDMRLSAKLPTPPGWDTHYNQALGHSAPFLKFRVDPECREFEVLQDFIGVSPHRPVNKIHRIINPTLWKRFLATRKEIICAKSYDREVLRALGMKDDELDNRTGSQLNPHLPEYADNVALLFHCTKNNANVDAILSQGLDERLSGQTGWYGKGVYFADDPELSMMYDRTDGNIFIFAVHLGDCCPFPGGTIVREPAKASTQQRSQMDLTFDSVLGGDNDYNEYVIFNRHQCYPMYVVSYKTVGFGGTGPGPYEATVRIPPTFAWLGNASVPAHPWPFFAKIIFQEMYVPIPQPQLPRREVTTTDIPLPCRTPSEKTIQDYLRELVLQGFTNDEENKVILAQFDHDFLSALNYSYLGKNGNDNGAQGASKELNSLGDSAMIDLDSKIEKKEIRLRRRGRSGLSTTSKEECPFCYSIEATNWKVLKCGHKLCNWCVGLFQKKKTTMSGQRHVFLKCPFCNFCDGVEIGSCPNGSMKVTKQPQSAAGYEGYPSICIKYHVPQGRQHLHRTAYLPDTPEGNKVLRLLRIAFDRRLCFSIIALFSATGGEQDDNVWKIHHKTALHGGVADHGYPDPAYLTSVMEELKRFGVQ